MAYPKIFSLFIVFIVFHQIYGRFSEQEITTSLGKIIGRTFVTHKGKNISAFLQIPYAQSPVGNLRFKNPLPALPWKGTLIADEAPPPCPQIDDNGKLIGTEDCLFLNIYTPKVNTDYLFPTMVYIHGGAFQRGHANPSNFGPNFILDKNVVLVTIQYRLGVLGFLSTGDITAPGNFGLKDQTLALRWIRDNIKDFGGDPNSVTLFGQSSGGVSVSFQVLSPTTKGLFHRYISQSGSALCPWAFAELSTYKNYAFELGKNFNCSTNTSRALINCLRTVDAYNLIQSDNIFSGLQRFTGVSWVPTNEPNIAGAFLTELPIEIILKNEIPDLPNINGVVKDEGLVVVAKLYDNQTLYDTLVGDIQHFIDLTISSFGKTDNKSDIAIDLKEYYFSDIDKNNKTQMLKKLSDFIGDISFMLPLIFQLQLVNVRIKSPCYLYRFEYRGTYSTTSYILKNNKNIGVTHADDLIYLFPSTPDLFDISTTIEFSESDYRMIDIMTDMWTNFAITGFPTSNFFINPNVWKPYSDENYYLRISANSYNQISLSKQSYFIEKRLHYLMMQLIELFL